MTLPFLLHLFATLFMCGLVWFVQIVHYPLFKSVPLPEFPTYQKKNFATGFVTVPAMTLELFAGLWVLISEYSHLFFINMLLLSLIWGSTFLFQVPTHMQLVKNPTHKLMNKLIGTNWIRTIGWSIRTGILGYMLL